MKKSIFPLLLIALLLVGCKSMGFYQGQRDYNVYNRTGDTFLLHGYGYGYLRGWEHEHRMQTVIREQNDKR